MSLEIELLDKDRRGLEQRRKIVDVAAPFLTKYFGDIWRNAHPPVLLLLPYPGDNNRIRGKRPLDYHTEAIGYIQVQIARGSRLFYYHPHTVAEVLEPGLQKWLDDLGDAAGQAVGYRIAGPEVDPVINRSTPIPQGVMEIKPYAPGERPPFRIRPIPPEPPAPGSLSAFGAAIPGPGWVSPTRTDFVKVVVDETLQNDLVRVRPFSNRMEEGGFLVGQIYEDEKKPETYIAHVRDAVPAERVGASFLHFTFTGDSFDLIRQRLISQHQGQRLLGWYHTHLFPATEAIGLSSIDLHLHFTTFRIPWQIAGLLNLDGEDRVLRFYVRQGDGMALCHDQPVSGGCKP